MINKIFVFSSYIWAISCYGFAALIAVMTKWMTHDPNLSGGPETPYLIPMLSIAALGLGTFGLAILTWIIAKVKKIKVSAKHFWISAAMVILLTVGVVLFSIGVRNGNLGYRAQDYTGQELMNAANEYRVSNGRKQLALDLPICDNLVARYLKIKSGDVGHEGFEEWIKAEGIDQRYSLTAELYVKETFTPADAIEFWSGSPGHNLTLLSDEVSVGCAYANDGVGVLIVGEPIKK